MRLLIIRHGEPDYKNDTLTEKGWREAELLSQRLIKIPVTDFYVSPLGRARDTAAPTLQKLGASAVEMDWLQEFPARIDRPDDCSEKHIPWDWLPQDWTKVDGFYSREEWSEMPVMKSGNVGELYRKVTESFDKLLAEHGYVRDGKIYRAEHANKDILVFFCHFGLECVLLSHLMNISPMVPWHHFCALTSSVTTLYTEERRKGIAQFRMTSFGDISHLYAGEENPSFAARFCEIWDDLEYRHD